MADQIVTRTALALAGDLESEANKLKTGLGLIYEALQFQYSDAEQAGLAQEQLYFLASALDDMQKRLELLAATAYALGRTEKAAA